MLREFKFLRRNSGKFHDIEDIENVPINPNDSSSNPNSTDSSRVQLHAIPEQTQNPKVNVEQEVKGKSKFDRTPTKPKGKSSDIGSLHLRTPERQGFGTVGKNRFGFSSLNECRDEGRSEVLNQASRNGGSVNLTPRVSGAVGKANTVHSESTSTQSTPTKSVSKPPNPGFAPFSSSRHHGSARAGTYSAFSRRFSVSGAQPSVVNSVEVPHFDLKEDPSFWMDHNVQVIVRVRPLNSSERNTNAYSRCVKQDSAQSISWIGHPETRFTFDHVACETVDQDMLFRMAGLPMIENCLSGYNSCMFAYGQTGSGKTYTMLGEIKDLEFKPSPHRGMTPRIFEFLFARIRAEEESRRDEKLKYSCKCSFLEIYNEQITDLLDPSSSNLLLREDVKKGVYVENLSEFEVRSVGDVLRLLIQGSSNRKVAATNMNRESSRSHSVFTCVIESEYERDSTTNLRFARLNLVDLAGSERQKSSGAEGERLKEAANINKSLSTLGHVIMLLVDIAHGKPRHVPYRDSRLTFLLQDSLGGNSKTMIIANISPSICCAAETLNTLKFAQRAKLIQNNAVVNEDSSGDVAALQHQIWLLKEELSALKHQHVSRTLAFEPSSTTKCQENIDTENMPQHDQQKTADLLESTPKGSIRVSSKQLKSLETMLAGALRREQMAETSVRQLEAEIQQLNRLVDQREEDNRCTKMMLKFREDKIRRMESLLGDVKPADAYLLEENAALSDEIQMLRAKIDKNPEVTRFASENIKLIEQLRRFQDFYEEGEREMLIKEVSELRDQLIRFHDNNNQQHNQSNIARDASSYVEENQSLRAELTSALKELAECQSKLKSCLDSNTKLSREIEDLNALLKKEEAEISNHGDIGNAMKEVEDSWCGAHSSDAVKDKKRKINHGTVVTHAEEMLNLELELDILKIILKEERLSRAKMEERASSLTRDVQLADDRVSSISKQFKDATRDLAEAKAVIEALESQQLLSINEIEDLKNLNSHYLDLLRKQELETSTLREKSRGQESAYSCLKHSERQDSSLQAQLKRMQASLDKAKRSNMSYQCDRASQRSNEEEMDEVRRQAEAETAEVIVCLQEELSMLQQQVQESELREKEEENRLLILETKLKELQETIDIMSEDNEVLRQNLQEKDVEMKLLTEDWELLACEIEEALYEGQEAIRTASDQLDSVSSPVPSKRGWISEQFGIMMRLISDKESTIEELSRCLEDANSKTNDLEQMLMSLRGAVMVMSESHEQECCEKEKEIVLLRSELSREASVIAQLENRMKLGHDQMRKTSDCATAAFVIVNCLSEKNTSVLDTLKVMDIQLKELQKVKEKNEVCFSVQASALEENWRQIDALGKELEVSEANCTSLRHQLNEQQSHITLLQRRLEENDELAIAKTKETLSDLKKGVSGVRSSINEYVGQAGCDEKQSPRTLPVDGFRAERVSVQTGNETKEDSNKPGSCFDEDLGAGVSSIASNTSGEKKDSPLSTCKNLESMESCSNSGRNNVTIILLKKEMESAMESLKQVQAEMVRLSAEKEEIYMSEKKSRESTETVQAEVLSLQTAFGDFEKHCESKILALNHKLQKVEEYAQEAKNSWWRTKEMLEFEVEDAKATAAQKTVEASCVLARFEEAQDTMKEADLMINGLMIANETMKLEIEDHRKVNDVLTGEKDGLINEVQGLCSLNEFMDKKFKNLEEQLELDVLETKNHIEELEKLVSLAQDSSKEAFTVFAHDFNSIKSQLQNTVKVMHSSLEDIWSEIIMKDCTLSVLHLCHMGVLLEAVTGLNAENGLLHHGICESNAVMSNLREQNIKSKEELEMCRMLKGKLLADIKNSFDRISSKEGETKGLSLKLSNFNEKLMVLQHQEEMMFERSNIMSSELAILMEELDRSNSTVMASLSEQEKLLRSNEEMTKSEAENFTVAFYAKDFELLVLASEMQEWGHHINDMKNGQIISCSALDCLIKDIVSLRITADFSDQLLLEREREVTGLLTEVEESKDSEAKVLTNLQIHEAECKNLREHLILKDEENESLRKKSQELKSENCSLLKDFQAKDSEFKSSACFITELELQNSRLQESIFTLESKIAFLEKNLEMKKAELDDYQCSQLSTTEALCKKSQDFESCAIKVKALEEENLILTTQLRSFSERDVEALRTSSSKVAKCVCFTETADLHSCRMLKQLDENIKMVLDQMSQDTCVNLDVLSNFLKELEFVDSIAKDLVAENFSLQEELFRKDEILNGLLFDLRLLQESAVSSKDQKDEIEELAGVLESTEHELALRSNEFDEAVAYGESLQAKLKEQKDVISALEMDLEKANQSSKLLYDENMELRSHVEDIMAAKSSIEKELMERRSTIDGLENELLEMGNTLGQMNELVESLKSNLNEVSSERDNLQKELVILEEKVETARVLAEENVAIAAEAQEIAESRRIYAEEKEEEVKLLETSVLELDSTISVLENKVEILKGEAERQRLQREELELELQSLKNQMHNVESVDSDIKRHLGEKSRNLQEASKRIKVLEKDLANKVIEISRCKEHISELTVHAEAQACEYKHKFKELEAMVEQLKAEEASSHEKISSSHKLEKNASKGRGSASPFKAKGSGSPFKARGSGSPFKCIGIGLSQQLKSEKDEEHNVEKLRIEELEALAANRQKEIFMLNARLAAAESMTHDVIRDLLGVRLNMKNCETFLDEQQVQKITEMAQFESVESQDQEVKKLKKQLNAFIEERQGWLEEIDRRQAELVAAQIALEKHRQQEQLLAAENEVLKMEIVNQKKRVTDLEGEVKKLSGQQNLHQRINHHAKIKEENNVLRSENKDLASQLQRAEFFISRFNEEIAKYRASTGTRCSINLDEEQRLRNKLKATEKERLQLAQTLLGLCTSILKAAGVTKPTSEVDVSAAEEALEQLCTRVSSLERDLEDLKIKNRIASERIRLAELVPDASPFSSRSEDNRQTPRRSSQSPFFSALDR